MTAYLDIRVVPGASRDEVVGYHGELIKVRIRAAAVDGKANAAFLRYLSEVLDLPKKAVTLESGERSREKRVRIEGLEPEEVRRRLGL